MNEKHRFIDLHNTVRAESLEEEVEQRAKMLEEGKVPPSSSMDPAQIAEAQAELEDLIVAARKGGGKLTMIATAVHPFAGMKLVLVDPSRPEGSRRVGKIEVAWPGDDAIHDFVMRLETVQRAIEAIIDDLVKRGVRAAAEVAKNEGVRGLEELLEKYDMDYLRVSNMIDDMARKQYAMEVGGGSMPQPRGTN